jgi:hypothetical protein
MNLVETFEASSPLAKVIVVVIVIFVIVALLVNVSIIIFPNF